MMRGSQLRRALPVDARGIVLVPAAVAEERRWIATEPPVDVEERTARTAAALADGRFALHSSFRAERRSAESRNSGTHETASATSAPQQTG
jgi:hypothetical protein